MKKFIWRILLFIITLLSTNTAISQIKPADDNPSYTRPVVDPPAYSAPSITNLVRTWTPKRPEAFPMPNNLTVEQTNMECQYYDGLGRLLQTVNWQASYSKKDLVQPVYFNLMGLNNRQYLPYSAVLSTTGATDGSFKPAALPDQYTYYRNSTYNPNTSFEQFFFSETEYVNSKLLHDWWIMAPGNSCVGSYRMVKKNYETIGVNEVINWSMSETPGSVPIKIGYYEPGELYRLVDYDEKDNRSVTYKDKDGRLIYTKIEIEKGADITQDDHWLCTYYVYNDNGLLRFVLPPKVVEQLKAANWQFASSNWNNDDMAKGLCFINEYDDRRNCILKKTPGNYQMLMVYDARDRLVLKNDRPWKQWQFVAYDELDRIIATGELSDNLQTREEHAALAANSISYPSYNPQNVLSRTFYDDYSWISVYGSPITNAGYENTIGNNAITDPATDAPFAVPLAGTTMPLRGLVTGTMVNVIGSIGGTNRYLFSLNVYDNKQMVIQTKSSNLFNGIDITTMQHDFSGRELVHHIRHSKPGYADINMTTRNEYDAEGRLLSITKNVNGIRNTLVVLNEYDEMGTLKRKSLGRQMYDDGTYSLDPIETQDYDYNIRGWLTGINKGYARGENNNYWFGISLGYDYGFTSKNYNGNLSGVEWRSRGDGQQRAYGYDYDLASRLLKADFTQGVGRTYNTDPIIDFSMKAGNGVDYKTAYDANGNLLHLWQKGYKQTSSPVIDDMTYQYYPSSNQVMSIREKDGTIDHQLGDFTQADNPGGEVDYVYDDNGNLITDIHSGNDMTYNLFNKPFQVAVTDFESNMSKGVIFYTYDGLGNKLAKEVNNYVGTQSTSKTIYCGPFIYEQLNNDPPKLQFILHEEGRIVPTLDANNNITDTRFDFFVKDHLQNVRMVLKEKPEYVGYMATMETANRAKEEQLFYNIPETAFPASQVPGGYPATDNTTTPNDMLVRVSGSTKIVGPAMILKVMAGDNVSLSTKYFFRSGGNGNTYNNPVSSIVAQLATSFVGVYGEGKGTVAQLNNSSSPLASMFQSYWDQNNLMYPTRPSAGMSWLLFDENFNWVNTYPQSTGLPTWGPADVIQTLAYPNIAIPKNGYLFVYVSNCSSHWDCFFDNLSIRHKKGVLLEETHYYPLGQSMTGICSQAPGSLANKFKFNGNEAQEKEFGDGTGIGAIDFNARMYDAKIGKFWQIDPLTSDQPDVSPYAAMHNNPVSRVDPMGEWDDYYINQDGSIDKVVTNDKFDQFYLVDSKTANKDKNGRTVSYTLSGTFLGQFNKNKESLISIPNNFNQSGWGGDFGFKLRPGSENIRYISGTALAALIGAIAETHTEDLVINGFSLSDGRSLSPSVSHKLGRNGDLRYLRTDKSGKQVTVKENALDINRQGQFNASLVKFGWNTLVSERFSRGTQTGLLLAHTVSAKESKIKSDHTNHLHLQSFAPRVRTSYVAY